jgi:hypothetical protein
VRSSIVLGSEASRLALRFLLWLHDKQSDPRLRAFVSFGALLLQIQESLSPSNLLDTCTWVGHDHAGHHIPAKPSAIGSRICFATDACLPVGLSQSPTPNRQPQSRPFS